MENIQMNKKNRSVHNITNKSNTSGTGLLGDLRSVTLGLLSFDALLTWPNEEAELVSKGLGLSWRARRGETFWGTSEDPLLKSK